MVSSVEQGRPVVSSVEQGPPVVSPVEQGRPVVVSPVEQGRQARVETSTDPAPRFVYYTASSLDGFLADEHGSLNWLFAVDHREMPNIPAFTSTSGVLVEGATTYEWVLDAERLLERPERWQELYGERPTYVFTHRDLPVPDGADVRLVRGEVFELLPEIRQAAGDKNVWLVGGGDLVGQFYAAGALDELQVTLTPVTLGAGAPLLPRRIGSDRLRLRTVEQYGQFAHLTYDVTPEGHGDRSA